MNHKVSETIDPGADICELESRHHNNVSCHFDIFLHCIYYVDYEKKVLNSDTDSKQFHQYQKKQNNHLSPQIIEHKKTITCDVGNPDPGLGQTQRYDGVKLVNGITILTLDHGISTTMFGIQGL